MSVSSTASTSNESTFTFCRKRTRALSCAMAGDCRATGAPAHLAQQLQGDPPASAPQDVDVVHAVLLAVPRPPLRPPRVRSRIGAPRTGERLLTVGGHHRLPLLLQGVATLLLVGEDEPVLVSLLPHLTDPEECPAGHRFVRLEDYDLLAVAADARCGRRRSRLRQVQDRQAVQLSHAVVGRVGCLDGRGPGWGSARGGGSRL